MLNATPDYQSVADHDVFVVRWMHRFNWSPNHSTGCIQVNDFCCCTELGHHKQRFMVCNYRQQGSGNFW